METAQILLIAKGYDCGGYGADGDFGNGTDKSTRHFQEEHNLTADGIIGEDTWTELLK